jgi:hypothetical protein
MQGKSSLLPAEPAATITVATDNHDCLTYTVAQAARLAGVSVFLLLPRRPSGPRAGQVPWPPNRRAQGGSPSVPR